VAVLQDDPLMDLLRLTDLRLSDLSLALAERYGRNTLTLLVGKLDHLAHRVCTSRKHNDDWLVVAGVFIRLAHVKGRRRNELLSKLLADHFLDDRDYLVRPQHSHKHASLHHCDLIEGCRICVLSILWKREVVDLLPLVSVLLNVVGERLEDWVFLGELLGSAPGLVSHPATFTSWVGLL